MLRWPGRSLPSQGPDETSGSGGDEPTDVGAVVMRDLSLLLWCDLETDEERIAFVESGRASATGIIAPAMTDEFVQALKCRIAIKNCIDHANGRETEWGSRAESAFQFLRDALGE